MQRAVGYSLTGDTRAQVLFLCWGTGANGKTTLMQALAGVFADYSATLAAETLLAKKHDAGLVLNDLASLQGARFVIAVESDMGRRLAEALVKQLTGGEAIKVKRLYADLYTIAPQFKLWIGTNHRPVIRGQDGAIWRRIRLVPFDVSSLTTSRTRPSSTSSKRSGRASSRGRSRAASPGSGSGLGAPDEVRRATSEYRAEMDTLGDFLAERCLLEPRATVTAADLYDAYTDWAKKAGENPDYQDRVGPPARGAGSQGDQGRRPSGMARHPPQDSFGPREQDAFPPRTRLEANRGNFQLRAGDEGLFPNPCQTRPDVSTETPPDWMH